MKNLDFHTTVIYPESLPHLQADMDSSQVNDSLRVIRLRTQNLVVKQTFLDLPGELKNSTVEENFARLLVGGDYPIVHFQDLSGWGTLALPLIAKQLDKKVIISLQDYFLLCPDENLVLPNGEPCGKVIADGQVQQCQQCLAAKQENFVREVPPLDKFLSERNGLVRQILQKADVLIAASNAIRERFIRAFGFLAEKIKVAKTSELEPDNYTHIYNNLLTEEEPKIPALQDQTAPFIQRLLGNETPSTAPVFHLGERDYKNFIQKQRVTKKEHHLSPLIPHLQKEEVPKVHLLIHLRRSQEKYLKNTLKDLSAQAYPHWHLSIIADFNTTDRAVWEIKNLRWLNVGSDDPIRVINHEISVIKADWVALIEAGDSCEAHLLSYCIQAINYYSDWQLIYVDEDSLSTRFERYDPKFKPEVNLDLLRSMPYLGRFCLVRREAQQVVGGYAPYFGMENDDIALKILDHYGEMAIGHIAQMLYHRLDMNEPQHHYGKDILRQHLKRNAIRAEIHHTAFPGIYWIDYPLQDNAFVSIIIATRNSFQSLQRCLQSLIKLTAYPHYEIIVVDNNSDHSDTLNYLDELKADNRIRVRHYTVEANVSELNNFAAQQARGEYLLFLNDDTEIIQAAWLQRLLALNQRQEIGIVGARLLDADQNVRQAGLILGMGAVGIAGQVNQGLPHNALGYMGRNQTMQNFSAVSEDCLMINKSLYQTIGGMDENAVLFNEVDFCLRVKEKGYQIVWTPHVSLVQHGFGSLVRNRQKVIKDTQVEQETAAMYQKWLPQLSADPAYNPLLRLKGDAWQPEIQIAVPWDIHLHEKPRIVAYPYDSWGVGEYRVRAPLRALQKADLADYALMPNHDLLRMPTPPELARMQTDTLFIHNMLHDDNLRALEQYKRFNPCFKIFGQDDLIYALPKTNPYYQTNYKDIKARVQMAISLCDRLIVATEPLAEAYRNICDDIWIMPNYLERSRWCDIEEGYKPKSPVLVGQVRDNI
jgi:GT2 family glycosyltransferase